MNAPAGRPRTDLLLTAARIAVRVGRHRRLLAALLAGVAVLSALGAVAPPDVRTERVLVAAQDISGASTIGSDDVRVADLPAVAVPSGALRATAAAVGHFATGPVRRGEVLTDVRVLGGPLLSATGTGGQTGDLVAAPVRLADAGLAALVHAGDIVDVVSAPLEANGGGSAQVVAGGLRVLAVPDPGNAVVTDGLLMLVAASEEQATALAAVAGTRLSVLLRDRS